jgi:hypothetical protein
MTTAEDARRDGATSPRDGARAAAPFAEHARRERRWWRFLAVLGPLVVIAWLLVRSVSQGTTLGAHAGEWIDPARSYAWAATSQVVWDRLAARLGTKGLEVAGADDPEAVRAMNRAAFPPSALDPRSVVVVTGDSDDAPARRFREQIAARWGNVPDDVDAGDPPPGALAAFAYLEKRFAFAVPFPAIEDGVRFRTGALPVVGSTRVEAFGVDPEHGGPLDALAQVRFHWHDDPRSPQQFVFELVPVSGDRILLARIDPGDTLERTWDVVSRVAAKAGTAWTGTELGRLVIPRIDVGRLSARFSGLCGTLPGGARLAAFREWVRVRLDGGGGAPASSHAPAGARPEPAPPSYVFDRPFFLALVEKGAERPYFLLWVGNADVLVRPP